MATKETTKVAKPTTTGATTPNLLGCDVVVKASCNPLMVTEGVLRNLDQFGAWVTYAYRGYEYQTLIPWTNIAVIEGRTVSEVTTQEPAAK